MICTEYAPDIFAHLRENDGYTFDILKESLSPKIRENFK